MINEKFEMYSPEILDAARSFLEVSKSLGNLEPDNLFKKLPSRPDLFPTDVDEDFFDKNRNQILMALLQMYRGELKENKTITMSNEFKRMQELSGVPVKEEKENLNEHYVAGGIVGVGAINSPFEGRKKESYEDAFEYFLEKKYNLKEAEEDGKEEDKKEDGKEAEEGIYMKLKNTLFPLYTDLKGEERVKKIDEIIKELNEYVSILQNEKTAKQS